MCRAAVSLVEMRQSTCRTSGNKAATASSFWQTGQKFGQRRRGQLLKLIAAHWEASKGDDQNSLACCSSSELSSSNLDNSTQLPLELVTRL